MKGQIAVVSVFAALIAVTAPAEAKGCVKGAAVGGVAGHVAGHHGLLTQTTARGGKNHG